MSVGIPTSSLYATGESLGTFSLPTYKQIITYSFNDPERKPRFGDNLAPLVRALYLAFTHKMPLACNPFEGLEQLVISERIGEEIEGVTLVSPEFMRPTVHTYLWRGDCIEEFLRYHKLGDELHVVRYGPYDSPYDYEHFRDSQGRPFPQVPIDPKNQEFINFLNLLIAPINPYPPIITPCSTSVAIHFRSGGTFDTREVKERYKGKFSDFGFYLRELKRIGEKHGNTVCCHIFTDGSPEMLMKAFQDAFPHFTFAYTKGATPLQDFFGIARNKWTYLIRPDSQFSALAGLLGQPGTEIKQKIALQQKNVIA